MPCLVPLIFLMGVFDEFEFNSLGHKLMFPHEAFHPMLQICLFSLFQNTKHYVHKNLSQILPSFRENLENASIVSTFLFV